MAISSLEWLDEFRWKQNGGGILMMPCKKNYKIKASEGAPIEYTRITRAFETGSGAEAKLPFLGHSLLNVIAVHSEISTQIWKLRIFTAKF